MSAEPLAPAQYVSVHACALDDGVAIVDAGWPTPEAWSALVAGLARIGYKPSEVRAVLVTHAHADHYGLSSRMREEDGARIGLHQADDGLIMQQDPDAVVLLQRAWPFARGASGAEVEIAVSRPGAGFFSMDPPDRHIADSDRPSNRTGTSPRSGPHGHSPGHLSFLLPADRVPLAGDHVLPRISPHVGASVRNSEQLDDNPLDNYLDSLRRMSHLDVEEVLPAHEYRFAGIRLRAEEPINHHLHRLVEVHDHVARTDGITMWEVAQAMTWSKDWNDMAGPMPTSCPRLLRLPTPRSWARSSPPAVDRAPRGRSTSWRGARLPGWTTARIAGTC